MSKNEMIAILREMAELLEINDANTFEAMAHRHAAQALRTSPAIWTRSSQTRRSPESLPSAKDSAA